MVTYFHRSWHPIVYRNEELLRKNLKLLKEHRDSVTPRADVIFKPFKYDLSNVKVVIPQAYPYEIAVASGFAWGSSSSVILPMASRCIATELMLDAQSNLEFDNSFLELTFKDVWAERLAAQGVLLLVEHIGRIQKEDETLNWKPFVDDIYRYLKNKEHVAWLLWGRNFRSLSQDIPNHHFQHRTSAPHTSNSSNPFLGSSPFSRCNTYLENNGLAPIHWLNSLFS